MLKSEFTANEQNEKWFTGVAEFKYGSDKKAYMSKIWNIYDGSIDSYVLGRSNNNKWLFDTLDEAIKIMDDKQSLILCDCGFAFRTHHIVLNSG